MKTRTYEDQMLSSYTQAVRCSDIDTEVKSEIKSGKNKTVGTYRIHESS